MNNSFNNASNVVHSIYFSTLYVKRGETFSIQTVTSHQSNSQQRPADANFSLFSLLLNKNTADLHFRETVFLWGLEEGGGSTTVSSLVV